MHILIIEDSPHIRDSLLNSLQRLGHEIQPCESVIEALELLHQRFALYQQPRTDLILVNIDMPYMDGAETCRHIQANEKFREIPILLLAAEEHLERLDEAFAAGGLDFISLPLRETELKARLKAVERLQQLNQTRDNAQTELFQARQESGELQRQLEEASQALKRLSTLDPLTELPNRRSFEIALEREWKRALRDAYPLALLAIEVDAFEAFNQAYGHPEGNECLKKVAGILSHYPYRPGDTAARCGGIEFAVLLINTHATGAAVVAENIRLKLAERNISHAASPVSDRVTVSMGVASLTPTPESSPLQLLETARQALSTAKTDGRDRVQLAN